MSVEDTLAQIKEAILLANSRDEEAMNAATALKPGMLLPGGNVVVPLEPTEAMLRAANEEYRELTSRRLRVYRAMLTAAGENEVRLAEGGGE